MLITNGLITDKCLKALTDSAIIFIYTLIGALLVIGEFPEAEDLYIILLLSTSAFVLSYANKMGIEIPAKK